MVTYKSLYHMLVSRGVQGRFDLAPAVLLGDLKGAFSHVRECPLCFVQRFALPYFLFGL